MKCEYCGTVYPSDMAGIFQRSEPLPGGGKRLFLRCPNPACRAEFDIALLTPKGARFDEALERTDLKPKARQKMVDAWMKEYIRSDPSGDYTDEELARVGLTRELWTLGRKPSASNP